MEEFIGWVTRSIGRFFSEVVATGIRHSLLAIVDLFVCAFRKTFGKKKTSEKRTWQRERGDAGEKFAADFLRKSCGMKILCRNFRVGKDEIDLVARDGKTLVFIEVKTRSENDSRGAVFAVDARKKTALRRAANAYLRGLRERPDSTRLDVVEVYVRESSGEMRAVLHCAQSWH